MSDLWNYCKILERSVNGNLMLLEENFKHLINIVSNQNRQNSTVCIIGFIGEKNKTTASFANKLTQLLTDAACEKFEENLRQEVLETRIEEHVSEGVYCWPAIIPLEDSRFLIALYQSNHDNLAAVNKNPLTQFFEKVCHRLVRIHSKHQSLAKNECTEARLCESISGMKKHGSSNRSFGIKKISIDNLYIPEYSYVQDAKLGSLIDKYIEECNLPTRGLHKRLFDCQAFIKQTVEEINLSNTQEDRHKYNQQQKPTVPPRPLSRKQNAKQTCTSNIADNEGNNKQTSETQLRYTYNSDILTSVDDSKTKNINASNVCKQNIFNEEAMINFYIKTMNKYCTANLQICPTALYKLHESIVREINNGYKQKADKGVATTKIVGFLTQLENEYLKANDKLMAQLRSNIKRIDSLINDFKNSYEDKMVKYVEENELQLYEIEFEKLHTNILLDLKTSLVETIKKISVSEPTTEHVAALDAYLQKSYTHLKRINKTIILGDNSANKEVSTNFSEMKKSSVLKSVDESHNIRPKPTDSQPPTFITQIDSDFKQQEATKNTPSHVEVSGGLQRTGSVRIRKAEINISGLLGAQKEPRVTHSNDPSQLDVAGGLVRINWTQTNLLKNKHLPDGPDFSSKLKPTTPSTKPRLKSTLDTSKDGAQLHCKSPINYVGVVRKLDKKGEISKDVGPEGTGDFSQPTHKEQPSSSHSVVRKPNITAKNLRGYDPETPDKIFRSGEISVQSAKLTLVTAETGIPYTNRSNKTGSSKPPIPIRKPSPRSTLDASKDEFLLSSNKEQPPKMGDNARKLKISGEKSCHSEAADKPDGKKDTSANLACVDSASNEVLTEPIQDTNSLSTSTSIVFYISYNYIGVAIQNTARFELKFYPAVLILTTKNDWILGEIRRDTAQIWRLCNIWDSPHYNNWKGKSITWKGAKLEPTLEFLLSVILRIIREEFASYLPNNHKDTLIAVPFWFTSSQRQQILDATLLAGFETSKIVNENTSSAYYMLVERTILSNEKLVVISESHKTLGISVYEFRRNTPYMLASSEPIFIKNLLDVAKPRSYSMDNDTLFKLDMAWKDIKNRQLKNSYSEIHVLVSYESKPLLKAIQTFAESISKDNLFIVRKETALQGLLCFNKIKLHAQAGAMQEVVYDATSYSIRVTSPQVKLFEEHEPRIETASIFEHIIHCKVLNKSSHTYHVKQVISSDNSCVAGILQMFGPFNKNCEYTAVFSFSEDGIIFLKKLETQTKNPQKFKPLEEVDSSTYTWIPSKLTEQNIKHFRHLLSQEAGQNEHNGNEFVPQKMLSKPTKASQGTSKSSFGTELLNSWHSFREKVIRKKRRTKSTDF